MSRIGKLPIDIPQGVDIQIKDNNIIVKGKLGQLEREINPDIKMEINDGQLVVTRPTDSKEHRSMHGLYRALLNNMVIGVSEGYKIVMEMIGVGYKATASGQVLEMALGYSHDIFLEMPQEVKVEAVTEKRANPIITLISADKQLVGHIAAKIRSFRPPEPYKGKGIRFQGEEIQRKQGKMAAS
jgi:large subunit ribosomal protein L6